MYLALTAFVLYGGIVKIRRFGAIRVKEYDLIKIVALVLVRRLMCPFLTASSAPIISGTVVLSISG